MAAGSGHTALKHFLQIRHCRLQCNRCIHTLTHKQETSCHVLQDCTHSVWSSKHIAHLLTQDSAVCGACCTCQRLSRLHVTFSEPLLVPHPMLLQQLTACRQRDSKTRSIHRRRQLRWLILEPPQSAVSWNHCRWHEDCAWLPNASICHCVLHCMAYNICPRSLKQVSGKHWQNVTNLKPEK